MRYSLFAGGKRMRPALLLAAAEACGGSEADALPLACAVECIHTYSLIHDDLPAMDNDDFRRGKPTNHKVFGEGIAVLAGDALLTQAFEIAAQCKKLAALSARQNHSGNRQGLRLAATRRRAGGGFGRRRKKTFRGRTALHPRAQDLRAAVLFRAARRHERQLHARAARRAHDFGYHVGLAFQVIDDILDVTQTSEQLGKTAGKDVAVQKATYPAIVGLEKSRKIAAQLTAKAFAALKIFKGKAVALEALAEFLLNHAADERIARAGRVHDLVQRIRRADEKPFGPDKIEPCEPFLMMTYFGPSWWIFFSAAKTLSSLVNWCASLSLSTKPSRRLSSFSKSGSAMFSHKSIVSATTNFGRCIWLST
jgi:geranylgeranyl diphosphate synthase, type II